MSKQATHLSENELAELRQRLEDRKRELLESIKALEVELTDENRPETSGGGLSDLPTHPADVGTDTFERDVSAKLLARERSRLHEVQQALERMDEGTYGICMGTDKPIAIERLRAKPWAKYSLEYARKMQEG